MTPRLLPLLALLAVAAPVAAADTYYDCSKEADKKSLRAEMTRLGRDDKKLLRLASAQRYGHEQDASEPRSCNVWNWCFNHGAEVKFSVTAAGDGVLVGLKRAPKSVCAEPWLPSCESATACKFVTDPLPEGSKPSRFVAFKEGDKAVIGQGAQLKAITNGGAELLGKAPSHEDSSGNAGDFPGLTFVVGEGAFKIQPGTGFIFRREAAGGTLKDTGAALPQEVFAALCAAAGAPCADYGKASCGDLGLSGSKGAFKDARGGKWKGGKEGCRKK